ncbi:hypothetical protein TVAG_491070 [Trichomonas vaginalis G3]|uniref:Uncharacterized protein n=1 Tax=Trichomonas vaginalis (strain ATCC PRA-98 / G3) TaxID=412133 RepID=A2E050_TRIV3|nr:regulation of choline O-acetyltransferase protein [Trichomonas vaginalis G3]EAY13969.1 hypothetical protein TVAG_491070 [Trichomonas vaginalis G3]KAI5551787.1 regulation of choline O-acetyltransferase protein [Trichomonas vaginalis G3]|eukprot:XP_001326192.1 hypothetical protein [Trichomonas vaginalis G3]
MYFYDYINVTFPTKICDRGLAILPGAPQSSNVYDTCAPYTCNKYDSYTLQVFTYGKTTTITCDKNNVGASFTYNISSSNGPYERTAYCVHPEIFCRTVKLQEMNFVADPFDPDTVQLQDPYKIPTPSATPKTPTQSATPKTPTQSATPKTPSPSATPKTPTQSATPKTPSPSATPKTPTPTHQTPTPTPKTPSPTPAEPEKTKTETEQFSDMESPSDNTNVPKTEQNESSSFTVNKDDSKSGSGKNGLSTKTWIIISASIGGAILVIIIVTIIFFKVKGSKEVSSDEIMHQDFLV